MRIHQLTEEIKQHSDPNKKSAYEIARILTNNKKLFAEYLDARTVELISKGFEDLSDSHPSQYGSPAFIRAFEQQYQSLLYNLDRII